MGKIAPLRRTGNRQSRNELTYSNYADEEDVELYPRDDIADEHPTAVEKGSEELSLMGVALAQLMLKAMESLNLEIR